MAVIGPRPALWNQDDLIAERDKWMRYMQDIAFVDDFGF